MQHSMCIWLVFIELEYIILEHNLVFQRWKICQGKHMVNARYKYLDNEGLTIQRENRKKKVDHQWEDDTLCCSSFRGCCS